MVLAHIVVLSAALLTLLVLPCVVTAALRAGRDEPCDDTVRAALHYYRSPRGRTETRELRLLDEALRADALRDEAFRDEAFRDEAFRDEAFGDEAFHDDATVPLPVGAVGPTIEQIARDLRRLGRQRLVGPAAESVLDAYDECLTLACRCLEITEHLRPLEGLDRDLERLRVESALQAAGFDL